MRSGQREKQQQYRFVENRDGSFFRPDREAETTLVYGSADYTRINPAMDEHGEINLLLFNGLTAHDADDNIVPGLAEKWEYDAETCTYTFISGTASNGMMEKNLRRTM